MKILILQIPTRIPINDKYEKFCVKAGSRWPWTYVKRKNEPAFKPPFPFYLAYSASIAKNLNFDIEVIDGVALDIQNEELHKKIIEFSPDIILTETTTHSINYDIEFLKQIKERLPSIITIITGGHVTVEAKDILENNNNIDFVILGEYELAFKNLILAIRDNNNYSNINSIGYKEKSGNIIISKNRYPIENLDELPMPLYDYFPIKGENFTKYYLDGQLMYSPGAVMHSSRGCPYGCDFCMWTQVMYGNRKYRMFSPKKIVDEMEYLIENFKVKEIYFDDDDFCINKQHVFKICDEIINRKLKIKWSIMGDAMACDIEMVNKMKQAGLISMKYGIESGNKDILKNIGKPLNLEYAKKFAKEVYKKGIFTHATFSLGLTGETKKTLQDTLKFALSIPFDYAQVSITTPFPGTRFYNKMLEQNAIKSTDWKNFDGTTQGVVEQNDITPEYLVSFKNKMIKKIIFSRLINPRWIFRFIKKQFILINNGGGLKIHRLFSVLFRFFFVKKK